MRADRGLLAGTGTSVSLVAAAAVLLFVVSGFIAFVGWPGAADANSAPPLTLADSQPRGDAPPVSTRPSPSRSIVLSAPPAPFGSARPQPGDRTQRERLRDRRGSTAPSRPGAFSGPSGDRRQEAGAGARRPAEGRNTGGALREVTRAGAEVTRSVTRDVGGIVAPVAPDAAQSAGEAGRAVGDLAQRVGDDVARVLDGAAGR